MSQLSLTDRDREILRLLTRALKFVSLGQLREHFWPGAKSTKAVRQRVGKLQDEGYVEVFPFFAQTIPTPTTPLFSWAKGEPTPDFYRISYALRQRWSKPAEPMTGVRATKKAATRFSGLVSLMPKPMEFTHDLLLSGVALMLRSKTPGFLNVWTSEASLKRKGWGRPGLPLPDAGLTIDGDFVVIECAAQYKASRLAHHHDRLTRAGVTRYLLF